MPYWSPTSHAILSQATVGTANPQLPRQHQQESAPVRWNHLDATCQRMALSDQLQPECNLVLFQTNQTSGCQNAHASLGLGQSFALLVAAAATILQHLMQPSLADSQL
jgi:hypothetical protein